MSHNTQISIAEPTVDKAPISHHSMTVRLESLTGKPSTDWVTAVWVPGMPKPFSWVHEELLQDLPVAPAAAAESSKELKQELPALEARAEALEAKIAEHRLELEFHHLREWFAKGGSPLAAARHPGAGRRGDFAAPGTLRPREFIGSTPSAGFLQGGFLTSAPAAGFVPGGSVGPASPAGFAPDGFLHPASPAGPLHGGYFDAAPSADLIHGNYFNSAPPVGAVPCGFYGPVPAAAEGAGYFSPASAFGEYFGPLPALPHTAVPVDKILSRKPAAPKELRCPVPECGKLYGYLASRQRHVFAAHKNIMDPTVRAACRALWGDNLVGTRSEAVLAQFGPLTSPY